MESSQKQFKVVLTFTLKLGMANEELRRSQEATSFPNRLAQQPGFIDMELAKISDEQTMSIQTWSSQQAFFAGLEGAKATAGPDADRDDILVKREFLGGTVEATF